MFYNFNCAWKKLFSKDKFYSIKANRKGLLWLENVLANKEIVFARSTFFRGEDLRSIILKKV